jgi:hypothetical protein
MRYMANESQHPEDFIPTQETMADDLGSVKDPLVRDHVQHVYESVLACRNKTRAEDKDNPTHSKLEAFLSSAKKPYNLLYIDPNLSKEDLRERVALLGVLYRAFKSASLADRTRLEPMICRMFGMPQMPADISSDLDELEKSEGTELRQGAENRNMIFPDGSGQKQVIKITKDRHNEDFTSVLKLMYDMHAIALRLNHEPSSSDNVEINLSYKDMVIYKDPTGAYRRMVRQDFAEGVSIKSLPKDFKENDPGYRAAWKIFLKKVESMRETDGVVLDISDSDAGFKKQRGNINNTGNVFVKLPDDSNPNYKFTVIDPDVFDTAVGEHKFDPSEYIRAGKKTGILTGIIKASKMAATNQARERVVRPWQDSFVKDELS